jgi:hypothetical protein
VAHRHPAAPDDPAGSTLEINVRPGGVAGRIGRRWSQLIQQDLAVAHNSGNEESARLLAKVVDVIDLVTGTVRVKPKVVDAGEMALDTRSSKTIRVKK